MKKPRPTVVEKILAQKAAAPPPVQINPQDVGNVLIAARRGIGLMQGVDLVNVAASIANLDAVLAAMQAAAAPPAPATPPAPPAEPAKA